MNNLQEKTHTHKTIQYSNRETSWKDRNNFLKNEIFELKNTPRKIIKLMDNINSRIDQTDERMSKLEYRLFENTQLQEKKRMRGVKKSCGNF